MVFHYVLFEFDWDKVKFSKMSKVIKKRIIEKGETYKDILGESDYEGYKELRDYYYKIYDDMADIKTIDDEKEIVYEMCYPIPEGYQFTHYDDFGADRSYGGERNHMGNDIMANIGTPIVAVASGIIEKIGWNELGGWRIGIRDNQNRYWYYAHMKEYAEDMKQGKRVYVGNVIGYVGSSGYGSKGTTGKFADHLHIQIGVEFQEGKLTWVNPYEFLMTLRDNNRKILY
ncbi:Murein DD-endopeptidase MepM and murein hydrolase activator NlpD, contain LysM domain [Paramaledivibacter caminithermalis DSM 15212]|uniref:Murein DD-endopeptidase MepM and murein hydrolase activator NlpD, contain LysM domain n=2 Tax=Paramaledivibacter TaxID=1884934 RepID=A0A1M6SRT2_PARC5|nr:Murein DD-endopeptidase MepM and murein hydrolase activator NlpD, contain LysM domain [Paramaledivibacter caminithermalis DSM 15212]